MGIALAVAVAGAVRLARPLPDLTIHVTAPPSVTLGSPDQAVPVALPPTGASAVATDIDGLIAGTSGDTPRPIASVAKVMAALVVLDAHPLAAGAEGPTLAMSDADVALYRQTLADNGSNLPVTAGEHLTERQLLLALMLPSANNIAETLALWVSGSRDGFVERMNQRAATMGMSRTHFADPSGLAPATVASANDLVRLGQAALANPALAAVVATPSAHLPDGTVLTNLDVNLTSVSGWLGIKTGDTPQAGSCLLFAARRSLSGGGPVTVIGAVLGQPSRFDALISARAVVDSTVAGYGAIDVSAAPPQLQGSISSAWDTHADLVAGVAPRHVVVGRQGMTLTLVPVPAAVSAPVSGDAVVATVEGRAPNGRLVARWPVVTSMPLAGPSWWWHLLH